MVEANGDPHRAGEQMDVAGLGATEPLRARGHGDAVLIDYLVEEGNDDA